MATTFPLRQGSKGEGVKALQAWLNLVLELKGSARRLKEDGDYGPATAGVVSDLFGRTEVTEADYRLARASLPNIVARLRSIRSGGPNPQELLDRIIEQDRATFKALLRIAQAWDADTAQGRKAKAAHYAAAWKAAARLKSRANTLASNKSNIVFRYGLDPEDVELARRYGERAGLGALQLGPSVAIVVVAIIVGAAATVAIVDWLTPAYRESTTDFKETARLKEILSKLPEAERREVLEEAERQVDKAYSEGRRDGTFGGAFGAAKWVLMAVGGYFAWTIVIEPEIRKRRGA
jgi:peptidoglycan hydrolase-like protein with peptidoglycan-binding domain